MLGGKKRKNKQKDGWHLRKGARNAEDYLTLQESVSAWHGLQRPRGRCSSTYSLNLWEEDGPPCSERQMDDQDENSRVI